MSSDQEKRLRRIILLTFFLGLGLAILIVAFFSYKLGETDKVVRSQGDEIKLNTVAIEELKQRVNDLSTKAKIPGPRGHIGKAGKDSVSTHTQTAVTKQIVTQVPLKGLKGDKGDPGRDARQLTLCRLEDGIIGWRFVDNVVCLEIEP